MPVMRRLGELPFVVAVREALPWSFIGLAAAFVVILAVAIARPARRRASRSALRLAAALLPAFGVMAAALVVVLADSPRVEPRATRSRRSLLGSVGGFALALPRPFGPNAIAYLRSARPVGTLRRDSCVRRYRLRDRVVRAAGSAPSRASTPARCCGVCTFGALLALLHVSLPAAIARGDAADRASRRHLRCADCRSSSSRRCSGRPASTGPACSPQS